MVALDLFLCCVCPRISSSLRRGGEVQNQKRKEKVGNVKAKKSNSFLCRQPFRSCQRGQNGDQGGCCVCAIHHAVRAEPVGVGGQGAVSKVIASEKEKGDLHEQFAADQTLKPKKFTGGGGHEWILERIRIPACSISQWFWIHFLGYTLAIE